jgi:diguanylate cyclase (GGDEF)-like protein
VGRWQKSFLHFSYVDVITSYAAVQKGQKPVIDLKNFKDKICFVGTSAAGLFDIRPTPLEPAYPAVGVNLTVLNNLLERKFIYPANYFHNLGILLFLILLLFKITKLKSYFKTAVWIVALVAGYAFLAVTLFIFFDVWIQMIYPFILILATYFSITLYSQLSVAIERTRLLKLATRDSLTGLYNIGHFRLLLGAELATLAMHKEKKISILMSDVDNFKKTNDTYGHVTGDTVLKEVASEIKSNCRALDVAARYGGEEFIVMFPGASAQEAFKIAEKLRKAVSEKIFFHETGNFSTTISLGITQINSSDKNIEDIVARADKALYEAKQTGKNKTVLSSS